MNVVHDPWVRCRQPRPGTGHRLICFPPAGASAGFYRDWPAEMPADVELWAVQYPGREDRFDESPLTDLSEMADRIAETLGAAADRPLWLFGHSMGAALGFEVARRLEVSVPGAVERLIVSGRAGPRHQRENPSRIHLLDDAGLMAELLALGGIPDQVLAVPELCELLLPILRADFELIETHRPDAGAVIDVPILALVGDNDPHASVEHARAWAEATTRSFQLKVHPGDHFFLVPHLRAVVADIVGAGI